MRAQVFAVGGVSVAVLTDEAFVTLLGILVALAFAAMTVWMVLAG